ncbi:MAG TPA: hypothetical protein VFZ78_13125, partial [Flavisolibacter sp.]
MRKLYLSFLPLIFVFTVSAQTTIIDPAGAGGFEAGNTFAANGWTVVNGATNQWFVGPLVVPSAGTNSAYISQDPAGAVYTYNITSSSVVYFYRDVTFPAGLNDIVLSFKWKAQGESTWDWIAVWSAPTSVTPVVNLPSAGSASWNNVPTTYPGAELHGVQPYNLQGTYQTATICLPASYAGTTRRLVFMWSNDGSVGTQPPASIDEISLVSSTPTAPTAQPTALVLTATSSSQIDGSFTAATGSPSGYLVVRYPTGATPVAPVNGTTYLAGSALGTGTVVSAGPGTTFTSAFLSAGTGYDFYVYAFSTTSACAGPQYNVTTPLMGTQTTPGCTGLAGGTYSVGPTGTYPTLTAAITAISGGITGPVILELQAAYTSAAETFPITFPFNNCITATNTLTIRPAAGATNLQITSAATPATIDFNGAKYVTIDGRPGGTGTAIQLSVINTATAGAAIRFINDASNNTVTYTDVQGQNTSATSSSVSGVIYFSTANTTSLQGNDNNTISFSRIHATTGGTPAIGISASGTTTSAVTYNDNNIITNNWIYDYFSASLASSGIKVDAGNSTWTISNNSFYQTASRSVTSAAVANRGIWVTPNTGSLAPQASGFIITGNYIGGDAANAAGNPYTITSTTSAQF